MVEPKPPTIVDAIDELFGPSLPPRSTAPGSAAAASSPAVAPCGILPGGHSDVAMDALPWVAPELDEHARADLAAAKRYLGAALPDEGWVAEVARAMVSTTSAPIVVHVLAALTYLATALGNRVALEAHGTINHCPSIWTVVLGPTGIAKSTSINGIWHTFAAPGLGGRLPLPDSFSQEGFQKALAADPGGVVIWDEWAFFLSQMARDFNAGLPSKLMSVYYHEPWRKSLSKEGTAVVRPAFSQIGATTATNLQNGIRQKDLGTGLYNRHLWAWCDIPCHDRKLGRDAVRPSARWVTRLRRGIHLVSELGPRPSDPNGVFEPQLFAFAAGAAADLDEFVSDDAAWAIRASRLLVMTPDERHGFVIRHKELARKLAALYRVSEWTLSQEGDPLLISRSAVASATAMVDWLWSSLVIVFTDKIVWGESEAVTRRLEQLLDKRMPQPDLVALIRQTLGKTWGDVAKNVETLLAGDAWVRDAVRSGQAGAPRVFFEPGPRSPHFEAWRRSLRAKARHGDRAARAALATMPNDQDDEQAAQYAEEMERVEQAVAVLRGPMWTFLTDQDRLLLLTRVPMDFTGEDLERLERIRSAA